MRERYSKDQKAALLWLKNRGATGVFDRNQVLVAAGERAPVMRQTWNRLAALGAITIDKGRANVTEHGLELDLSKAVEAGARYHDRF
jgi:hypothetical protein